MFPSSTSVQSFVSQPRFCTDLAAAEWNPTDSAIAPFYPLETPTKNHVSFPIAVQIPLILMGRNA